MFLPGQSGNPNGRKKGSKNRITLLKEERRAIFDEKVSKKWNKVIDNLPPVYIADQFIGKAPDKVELSGELETITKLDEETEIKLKEFEQWRKSQI